MAKKQERRIAVLLVLALALAMLVFSRAREAAPRPTPRADGVELILPPREAGAETPQVYDDLPELDISSWEYLLVNQAHNIGRYAPEVEQIAGTSSYFDVRALDALNALLQAARDAGYTPHVYVGYRSYVIQSQQFDRQVTEFLNQGYSELDAEKAAAEIVAEPGTSEHQSGLGGDILDRYTETLSGFEMDANFAAWLRENCVTYGFVARYPEEKISVTGRYEPWHVRYVGAVAAQFMTEHDLALEEFVALYR